MGPAGLGAPAGHPAARRLAGPGSRPIGRRLRAPQPGGGAGADHRAGHAPGFAWDPADARFLGKPVDYVVFDGYAEVRAGARDHLRQIVFVDVKTGRAGLSKAERRIKACVESGAVHGLVLPVRSSLSGTQAPPDGQLRP
ncbi:MAG: Holliday junction resolvase-like protein [Acidimicrobiales bacterium]